MKKIIILLSLAPLGAFGQTEQLTKKVNDNGKSITIEISYKKGARTVHFKKAYDVKGKSGKEKEKIVQGVLDSLHFK